jgi:UDP-glucuronate decarboxylase
MTRILITGGAGFLGSNLCERLAAQGNSIICVDNYSSGVRENVNHMMRQGFEIIEHDITTPLCVDVDQIYNLACPASPRQYQLDPVHTTKTNVQGAMNILTLARTLKAKVLQASTSEIYGDPQTHPQSECYWGHVNPVGVRSCYDEGKRCAESLFLDYHRRYRLNVKVVRIFNTYGPRMQPKDGRVVSNFIVSALQGEDITIYGDGRQTRSFCFVDDMIEAMIRTMETGAEFTGPLNLGNPDQVTILELAERVLYLTKSSSRIRFMPLPPDDPRRRQPDITLARQVIGWQPAYSLEHGLLETIDYFRWKLRVGDFVEWTRGANCSART